LIFSPRLTHYTASPSEEIQFADLLTVPLPIFVELQGLVGTVRLRLQLSPEPPFLKALAFALMGVPKVQAGCVPMLDTGVNILNLPLILDFVNYTIGVTPFFDFVCMA
jgi:Ca2+-dependent lipid-binding protein